jgi:preprotein translocase subunit SecG
MHTVLLVVHLLVTLALIGVVLIQKSEGGALGIGGSGGGGGGMGGFMTGRATANLLTRTTGILAALFFILSLTIAWYNQPDAPKGSILDSASTLSESAPAAKPEAAPETPATPAAPTAPVAQ